MGRYWWKAVLAGGLLALAPTASIATVPSVFAAENSQGNRSVVLAPVWYFFHDGTFDAFDVGAKATPGVKEIADAGFGGSLRDEFRTAQPNGLFLGIVHGVANQNPYLLQFDAREQDLDPVKHRYMSYLSRVSPSDDAFVGNDSPTAYEVFDEHGTFLGPIVVELAGAEVLDAGTRLNDELDLAGIDVPGYSPDGITTDDVIREHPGFNGSLRNPSGQPQRILGAEARYVPGVDRPLHFVDAIEGDFTRPNFRLNRFRLTSHLSSYFSGAWYDPARSGEGFLVSIFDAAAPKASLTWFTYAPDDSGRQMWLYGAGPIDINSAEIELFETEGGRMGSTDNPANVRSKRWGKATLGFSFCDAGAVIVEPDDPALARGAIYIQRLTAPAAGTERDCGAYTFGAPDAADPPF